MITLHAFVKSSSYVHVYVINTKKHPNFIVYNFMSWIPNLRELALLQYHRDPCKQCLPTWELEISSLVAFYVR